MRLLTVRAVTARARRLLAAGGVSLVIAAGLAGCGDGDTGADGQEPAAPSLTTAPPTTAEPSTGPTLGAAEVMRFARGAMLSPDSPLVDGYEETSEPFSINDPRCTPLYRCTRREVAEGRRTSYHQVFEGPEPTIEITAHAYERSPVEVLDQLRDTWESECVVFEKSDAETPYRWERIDTVAAPDGVESAHWAGDRARVRPLEGRSPGVVYCTALMVIGEYLLLEIELDGPFGEWERYAELLRAIATEVRDSQE